MTDIIPVYADVINSNLKKMKKEFNLKAYRFKLQRPKYLQVLKERIGENEKKIRYCETEKFPNYLHFTTGEICKCLHQLKEDGWVILLNSVVVNNTNYPDNIPYYEGYVRAFKRPKDKDFPKGICFNGLRNSNVKIGFYNPRFLSHSINNYLDEELLSKIYGDEHISDGQRALDLSAEAIKTKEFIKILIKT